MALTRNNIVYEYTNIYMENVLRIQLVADPISLSLSLSLFCFYFKLEHISNCFPKYCLFLLFGRKACILLGLTFFSKTNIHLSIIFLRIYRWIWMQKLSLVLLLYLLSISHVTAKLCDIWTPPIVAPNLIQIYLCVSIVIWWIYYLNVSIVIWCTYRWVWREILSLLSSASYLYSFSSFFNHVFLEF